MIASVLGKFKENKKEKYNTCTSLTPEWGKYGEGQKNMIVIFFFLMCSDLLTIPERTEKI